MLAIQLTVSAFWRGIDLILTGNIVLLPDRLPLETIEEDMTLAAASSPLSSLQLMTPGLTPAASPGDTNQADFSPQTPEAGCQNTPTTSSLQLFSPPLELLAGGGQPFGTTLGAAFGANLDCNFAGNAGLCSSNNFGGTNYSNILDPAAKWALPGNPSVQPFPYLNATNHYPSVYQNSHRPMQEVERYMTAPPSMASYPNPFGLNNIGGGLIAFVPVQIPQTTVMLPPRLCSCGGPCYEQTRVASLQRGN
jgi:hypothetical protein